MKHIIFYAHSHVFQWQRYFFGNKKKNDKKTCLHLSSILQGYAITCKTVF